MKPLLRDPSAQERFDRDGYLVVPLLSCPQVDALMALYVRHVDRSAVSGLYESSRHNPYDVNRAINDAIRQEVEKAAAGRFLPATIYGGTFMVKSHVDSSVLPLHQDWSVVDEERRQTMFLWCPLEDVSVTSGALFVLPGSHRWFASILRSGSYPSNRYLLPVELHDHVIDVPLRAGEAIVYSDALFHGSHANSGPRDRVVVTARITEPETPLVYFHKHSDTEVDVYEASPEFYLTHIDRLARGLVPQGTRRLNRRPYSHVAVTDQSLEARIRQHDGERGGGCPTMQLFRDSALQHQFEASGFVVLDLIDQGTVDRLRAFHDGLSNAAVPQNGFQVSLDNESSRFVRAVSERLVDEVGPSVERHLTDHQIFTASFVTKSPNPLGVVPPHQDWTFVDESRFWSATMWCPLVDVNVENGALALLKGSHLLYDHVRPSPSPQYAPPFKDQLRDIFPYMQLVDLRAGQAVVFNNRTLHASPPNGTDRIRIAFGIGVTHRDARLRHYYLLPGQPRPAIEGYEVTPEFFVHYNNARLSALYQRGDKPRGLDCIGLFAVRSRQYDTSDLVARIRAAGNREDAALGSRVAALAIEGAAGTTPAAGRPKPRPADGRPLWKVYTPANIVREIRYRLTRP